MWYSRPELNRDTRIRNPLLYPLELREQIPNAPQYKQNPNKKLNLLTIKGIDFLQFAARRYYKLMPLSGSKNTRPVDTGKPTFNRVAQCLYRNSVTNIYYALIKKRGKQNRKSLKTTDRQLAERRLIEFRAQIHRNVSPTLDRNITFMELAKGWFETAKSRYKPSSARSTEGHIKQLNKFLGIIPIRNITLSDLHHWERTRGAKISASSFNHEKTVLGTIFEYALRDGLILENKALTIARRKTPTRKITIPSREQFSLLVSTIRSFGCRAQEGADLVEILAYSGMRLSEAI